MIIRSKEVKAETLEIIYKTLREVIKDESCYYSKEELEDLENRGYIKLEV